MIIADVVWKIVSRYADTVFFVPGGGCAFLVDALGKSGLNHISMLHEQGAGMAAIGYAQAKKGLGVCFTTSGPGATNAVTPCLAAWTDSVPVLFISGTPNKDTLIGDTGLRIRGVQEVDITKVVGNITKDVIRPMDGLTLVRWLPIIINKALDGRQGPVWMETPLDVSSEVVHDITE